MKQEIKVCARLKPSYSPDLIEYQISKDGKAFKIPKRGWESLCQYQFDCVFEQSCSQEELFREVAVPVINNCLEGYNGTIFVYGQTGSGKTHTMSGKESARDWGVIPRTLQYIFESLRAKQKTVQYEVKASFIQIYNESAYDLFEAGHVKKLQLVKEDNSMRFADATVYRLHNKESALQLFTQSSSNRKVACTTMNQRSSRSHCDFVIRFEGTRQQQKQTFFSQLHLVDLAGSERVGKTEVQGKALEQAKNINLSLSYLEQVVIQLKSNVKKTQSHVSYRNSLMTSYLRNSLGGNCSTVMVITVNLEKQNLEQTKSTLDFSQRIRGVKQSAKRNLYNDTALLAQNKQLRARVAQLQRQLSALAVGRAEPGPELDREVEQWLSKEDGDLAADNLRDCLLYLRTVKRIHRAKMKLIDQDLVLISKSLESRCKLK